MIKDNKLWQVSKQKDDPIILDIEDLREPMNQITEAIWSHMK